MFEFTITAERQEASIEIWTLNDFKGHRVELAFEAEGPEWRRLRERFYCLAAPHKFKPEVGDKVKLTATGGEGVGGVALALGLRLKAGI